MIETDTILTLPEQEFRDLVDQDTRLRASPEVSAALRTPEVVGRWYETLMAMQKSVEGQLAAKMSDAKAKLANHKRTGNQEALLWDEAQFERWRAGAIRFKSGLEQRLLEARRLLREYGDPLITDRLTEDRNRAWARVTMLEDAIRRHRDSFPAEDDPSDADEELWAHVGR